MFISKDGISWHYLFASVENCFTVPIPFQWSLLVAKEKPTPSKPNCSNFLPFPFEKVFEKSNKF